MGEQSNIKEDQLSVPDKTDAELVWAGDQPSSSESQMTFNYNQQVNLFGDLVGFKELENVSPEIRDQAFAYLRQEQEARHQFVTGEQKHKHKVDLKLIDRDQRLQGWGQLLGFLTFMGGLVFAGTMFSIGQSAVGISTILVEAGGVVALVIWGQKRLDRNAQGEEADTEGEE